MKTMIKLLVLAYVLVSYIQVKAQAHDVQYTPPTFIGATPAEQTALLKQLSDNPKLDDAKQRQLLLLQLATFASEQAGTIEQLEVITQALQKYLKAHKDDGEIMAATGSATSLQSVFYADNLGKMNFLSRKGMRLMDRAVKKFPHNLGARLLRGLSYANMPAFLNRASFAEKDLTLVKNNIAQTDTHFAAFVERYLDMAVAKQGASRHE